MENLILLRDFVPQPYSRGGRPAVERTGRAEAAFCGAEKLAFLRSDRIIPTPMPPAFARIYGMAVQLKTLTPLATVRFELLLPSPMKTITFLVAAFLSQAGNLRAQEQTPSANKSATKRVVFAQSCFWTGEMKLGQIEGVVRTEAGFFKGREVTLVEYEPARISLEDLARRAKLAGVANAVYLEAGSPRLVAGVPVGSLLDGTYRAAPADDQKKQLEGTPFSRLQLNAEQATKVNAFAREDMAKALEWLSPAQREQLKGAAR